MYKMCALPFTPRVYTSTELWEICLGRLLPLLAASPRSRMLPLLALVAHPLLAEIAAGCAGGMAKIALFHPLDYATTWRELPAATKRPPRRNPYAGVGLTLAGAAPYAAVFHSAFWLCARSLNNLPAGSRELLAGSGGAVAATAVGVPFECLKHRVQLQVPGYDTPLRALRSTLRDRELYAGTASTLCRNLPYNALHFGIFAAAQRDLMLAEVRRRVVGC